MIDFGNLATCSIFGIFSQNYANFCNCKSFRVSHGSTGKNDFSKKLYLLSKKRRRNECPQRKQFLYEKSSLRRLFMDKRDYLYVEGETNPISPIPQTADQLI